MEKNSTYREIYEVSKAIVEECLIHSVDPLFVIAIIQAESNFEVEAVSPTGARGLMQIMPSTFRSMSNARRMFDPVENVRAGIRYLRHLYDKGFGKREGPEVLLLAYNQGPGNALRSMSSGEHTEESRVYVPRTMSIYKNLLKKHGFDPKDTKKLFIDKD